MFCKLVCFSFRGVMLENLHLESNDVVVGGIPNALDHLSHQTLETRVKTNFSSHITGKYLHAVK